MLKEKALSIARNRNLLWFFKVSILLFSVWYIYHRVSGNPHFNQRFEKLFTDHLYWPQAGWLLLCVFLMPVNWLLEAKKWQVLILPIEQMTLGRSLKSVLTGLSIGFVSEPHLGNFFGRVWQLQSKERFRAIGASLLNSICQNYVTALAGTYGLFYLLATVLRLEPKVLFTLMALDFLLILLCTGALLKRKVFIKPLQRFKLVYPYVKVLSEYSKTFIGQILALSLLRFSLYVLQFVLLLEFFGSGLTIFQAVACVSMMYMAKTLLPSFSFLSELGIREFTALYFFGLYQTPEPLVIASTLTIWLINVLVPAIFGFYFAWNMKVLEQLLRKKPKTKTA